MKSTLRKGRVSVACLALLSVSVLSACGSSSDDDKKTEAAEKVGKTEGKVSILAWPGYVEDGSNDPAVDWVSAFEKDTGCEVTSKVYGTSDEALNLAKSGEYDVIAASGDLSLLVGQHTGLLPVQLQPPGTTTTPSAPARSSAMNFSRVRDGSPRPCRRPPGRHGPGTRNARCPAGPRRHAAARGIRR